MPEYYTKDEVNELLTRLKTELLAEIRAAKEEIQRNLRGWFYGRESYYETTDTCWWCW